MLWIFKVARWTCDRCTKINKSLTVSNGVRVLSFEIWTANSAQSLTMGTLTNSQNFIFGVSNWKFCKVTCPVGTPKPDIQMWIFPTWDWFNFYAFIFAWKKSKPVGYIQEHRIHKLGKIRSEPKLLFGVYYWFLKLRTGDHWTVTALRMGFHSERAAAGLGPRGLITSIVLMLVFLQWCRRTKWSW